MAFLMNRARNQEEGFVMIVAVVLLSVIASLGIVILTSGSHSDRITGHGRSYTQALHVAEAGIQDALVRLQAAGGLYSGTFTGSTEEGTFSVTVTSLSRKRYQVDARGSVGTGRGLVAARKVRVTLAPPSAFKYALFSYTSIDTKNNDHVTGDAWANQNVIVDNNDVVEGKVWAATGYVQLNNGSRVTGDVQSGGYNPANSKAIWNDGTIGGSAKASVTAPTDPVTCGGENQAKYSINGGTITGNATTWGTVSGASVGGTISNNICTAAPAAQPLPTYSYAASNYDPATLHEFGTPSSLSPTAASSFQSWVSGHSSDMKGTFTVFQSGSVGQSARLDLSGITVTGDLTIFTNEPIYAASAGDNTTDAIALFASTYQPPTGSSCDVNHDGSECSIHLKNNFQTSCNTAFLAYAPYGPVAVKNNQSSCGSIYAENIQIKNNQTLTYDARVDRVVGFGPVTLEPTNWMELPA